MSAIIIVGTSGRTMSKWSQAPLSTSPTRGLLPPEAHDSDWAGWRKSDAELMLDFGITRKVARLARERVGAPKLPPHRRRGTTVTTAKPLPRDFKPAASQIASRIFEQSHAGGPAPTRQLLASRTRALSEAFVENNQPAIRDGLVELAAGCGLMLDHLQRVAA